MSRPIQGNAQEQGFISGKASQQASANIAGSLLKESVPSCGPDSTEMPSDREAADVDRTWITQRRLTIEKGHTSALGRSLG